MPKKAQKRARAHHVLAQFYLRAWANERDAVSMLTREGREVTTGTEALAVEKDFYTATAPDGTKNSSVEEDLLRAWDGRGAEVHRRLLADDFPLDDDARVNFGLFLGLQWLRGRAARQVSKEFYDVFNKVLVKLGLELDPDEQETPPGERAPRAPLVDGPGIEIPRLGGLPEEAKALLRDEDAYTFEIPREQLLLQMVQGVPDAAAVFLEAQWVVARTEGVPLLTSDEPISLYREPTPQNQHFGLGPKNADVMQFPLSSNRVLVMNRRPPLGPDLLVDMPPTAVGDVNKLTVHGNWRQLFRHPDAPPFPPAPSLPERFVEVA
jgi:hypothetical protein